MREVNKKENWKETGLNYCFYSNEDDSMPKELIKVLKIFKNHVNEIKLKSNVDGQSFSDSVLKTLRPDLENAKYIVESGKKHIEMIKITPHDEKYFMVDALNIKEKILIEIEAGMAVCNYHFLKDIIECSIISNKGVVPVKNISIKNEEINIDFSKGVYLVLAVMNEYRGNNNYNSVIRWLEAICASGMNLGLKGILLIGY